MSLQHGSEDKSSLLEPERCSLRTSMAWLRGSLNHMQNPSNMSEISIEVSMDRDKLEAHFSATD
jgi:hypothetical protein